ncbi:MAG: hypothetical protein MJ071_08215 [Oscillospiraceae bacterium]|nr:hypothetical protein [Oscillospiraceae bacterium]
MKSIINGKVYDTSTAKKLAECKECKETMYQSETGEFFIYRKGKKEEIEPVTEEHAAEWAKKLLELSIKHSET